jgi:hypothetical protein
VLAEDYFRQDPDFERIARSAAKPLETLQAAAPIKASAEKEKRDVESILWGLRRRTWLFGVSLFLTLVPLSVDFTRGHVASLAVRGNPWRAAFDWSLAAVPPVPLFRAAALAHRHIGGAICFTLIRVPYVLHSVLSGGRVLEFAIVGFGRH